MRRSQSIVVTTFCEISLTAPLTGQTTVLLLFVCSSYLAFMTIKGALYPLFTIFDDSLTKGPFIYLVFVG